MTAASETDWPRFIDADRRPITAAVYAEAVAAMLVELRANHAAAWEFRRGTDPGTMRAALLAGIGWALSQPEMMRGYAPGNDALDALTFGRAFPDQITPASHARALAIIGEGPP